MHATVPHGAILAALMSVGVAAGESPWPAERAALEPRALVIRLESGPGAAADAAGSTDLALAGEDGHGWAPPAPAGAVDHLEITLAGTVVHRFSVAAGDGLPLDEAPEPVANAAAMRTVLSLWLPGLAEPIELVQDGRAAACSGIGSCMIEAEQAFAIDERIELRGPALAAVLAAGGGRIRAEIRTTGALGPQLCDPGGRYDICRVSRAEIGTERTPLTLGLRAMATAPHGTGPGTIWGAAPDGNEHQVLVDGSGPAR